MGRVLKFDYRRRSDYNGMIARKYRKYLKTIRKGSYMKIDVNAKITTMNGEEIPANVDGKTAPLTLGILAKAALLNDCEQNEKLTGTQRHHFGTLATTIDSAMKNGGVAEIDAGEVNVIKERIGKSATTWTVKQAWDLIESAETKAKAEEQNQAKPS